MKAGLTFAAALRSILRSDPDVVLIGEIRDHETAQIAIEASLTGHLVLSTLHTNDAPSAISRLIEMGIEPFLVGSRDRLRARPAARPQAVREVQGGLPAHAGSADHGPLPVAGRRADARAVPPGRLHPRAARPATRAGWRCTRSCRSARRSSVSPSSARSADEIGRVARARRHDHPARRRDGEGAPRRYQHRGDPPRRSLSRAVERRCANRLKRPAQRCRCSTRTSMGRGQRERGSIGSGWRGLRAHP